ncbi:DNA-binding CsgD family transcriptional regulator [Saccharothrix tamanrassetensis]|uniref:DNA-binding CsgD family transcriptional regulator n=1 Tax=Saccharothrix tamanrassetensis TaxID=1051531 RepID=A0A841CTN3_9PSEU|nr:LuxR family transcriptional regulator [Saccharothrix tamanrassetensis]MBB5959397.1 DNA-binding CsgD family transcriptional regulator [Saccharothrix tamanrassetensis]
MTPPRTSSPVLVGRGDELAALLGAVADQPAVALVEGEAGVGKSRLVRELLRRPEVTPLRVLTGFCQPLREPFPYGAVLDALRTVAGLLGRVPLSPVTGVLRPLLPEIADRLPDPPPRPEDPRHERHHLFRAVREVVAALGPVLLVVEDLHWADDGCRHLLRFLMADPPPDLTVLVTYRREDSPGGMPLGRAYRPPAGVTGVVVGLSPLDAAQVHDLAAAILDVDGVSAEFAARLHERTAGIPFVVEEVLRALRDPDWRLLDEVAVPALLRDAMAERLDRLTTTGRRIAQAAAVLGVPAEEELLAEVGAVEPDRARAALTHALRSGVLHEAADMRYGFRHILAQQAVYDTLTGPERQRLHLRASSALANVTPRPFIQLAEHSLKAGRHTEWLRNCEAAADRALEVGDPSTATRLYQRLLDEASPAPSDVDRLAVKLGLVARGGIDQHDPRATLERLLDDRRLSRSARGQVRMNLGFLLIRQFEGTVQARSHLEQAVTELADQPELAMRARAVLGQPFIGATPLHEHLGWMRVVDSYIESCENPEVRYSLLANELGSRLSIGDHSVVSELDRLPASSADVEIRRHLARANCNLADACALVGHFDLAHDFLDKGLRLTVGAGVPFTASTGQSTRIHLDWYSGNWGSLVARAGRLLDEYRELLPVASEISLVLGCLAVARGDWDEAERYLAESGVRSVENSITPVALGGFAPLARLWFERGDLTRACAEADLGLDLVRRKGVWAWTGELAPAAVDAYCAAGRLEDAVELVEELTAGVADRDAPLAHVALKVCRALVAMGRDDDAVFLLRDARRAADALGLAYYSATLSERIALCGLESGDASAVSALGEVADRFEALGAGRDAARCRHLVRGTGVAMPSRRGRRGYGNALSPREQDVARLLAQGRTNREIADVLFLSPRTVEQHVARVLRKLGVASRAELLA